MVTSVQCLLTLKVVRDLARDHNISAHVYTDLSINLNISMCNDTNL